jgi:carbamoyltransferase
MDILGISAHYHDSSACLFRDGKLIYACEEEKFTGIKHDSSFPVNSIKYIFDHFTDKVDQVCYYEKPLLKLKRAFKHNIKSVPRILWTNIKLFFQLGQFNAPIHYSSHHDSHLAYSYYTSPFNDATVISIDGVGEEETICIAKAEHGKLKKIKSIKYPHSLGLFYSAITSFLGFKSNEGEYKVMGLASYGNPSEYAGKFNKLICHRNGIKVNMKYFTWNKSNDIMFNHHLIELLGDNRLPDEPITQRHKDIAAALQQQYESMFFYLLNQHPGENLCLGGGCAYNGTANGKIKIYTPYKNIYIPPAPSDAGSCIGACLDYLKYHHEIDTYLGPQFDCKIEGAKSLDLWLLADELNKGKVVGWYEGKIEFGARALGHRSILASPSYPGMQDRINKLIKKREMFRPFAPMVTYEAQSRFFSSADYVPYMNQVVKVKDEYRNELSAVTHVDGTARIQSVKKEDNDRIHLLLNLFERQSGFPILLNTSFNVKDKTMILYPEDAYWTFLNTDIDILVINNQMIFKNDKTN